MKADLYMAYMFIFVMKTLTLSLTLNTFLRLFLLEICAGFFPPDIQPEGTCQTTDSDAECVAGATCQNVAADGAAQSLQCVCNPGFHQKTPVDGSPICEAGAVCRCF